MSEFNWIFIAAMLYGAGLLTGISIGFKIIEWDLRKRKLESES